MRWPLMACLSAGSRRGRGPAHISSDQGASPLHWDMLIRSSAAGEETKSVRVTAPLTCAVHVPLRLRGLEAAAARVGADVLDGHTVAGGDGAAVHLRVCAPGSEIDLGLQTKGGEEEVVACYSCIFPSAATCRACTRHSTFVVLCRRTCPPHAMLLDACTLYRTSLMSTIGRSCGGWSSWWHRFKGGARLGLCGLQPGHFHGAARG